ncbi:MAG: cysteine-rich CWC family protein [Acidobacteria bacterium]|nr:cysteine-rich CWC family protein [Acidobacteriota bacterium]
MLRKLAEFIQPDKRPPRECEACGKPFHCGASLKGCWCFQIKLSAEVKQQLRERYKDCLCSDCLERFAVSARPTP